MIPIQPCFYQDINVDIPVEFQRIVRYLYYVWILHAGVLIVNALVFILRLIFLSFTDTFSAFFVSLIYLFIFVPASYVCWFRPAYKAFRWGSTERTTLHACNNYVNFNVYSLQEWQLVQLYGLLLHIFLSIHHDCGYEHDDAWGLVRLALRKILSFQCPIISFVNQIFLFQRSNRWH